MKILLCNTAFVGDLILSTALLSPLKKALPHCQIGFLVGSWASEVVQDHIFVDRVHLFNQKGCNRLRISPKKKKREDRLSYNRAQAEVKKVGYDVALDLHSYYPQNAGDFIYKAQIEKRVAYWNCMTPFYYNQLLFWRAEDFHMIENHRQMLLELGIPEYYLDPFLPLLEYRTRDENPYFNQLPDDYILIHMGTGEPNREWPTSHWRELLTLLHAYGKPLVCVGQGLREKNRIDQVIADLPRTCNYANCFSFKQLIVVVKKARFIIGLESMMGHMAAAFARPSFFIYAKKSSIDWRPYHVNCQTIAPPDIYFTKEMYEQIYPKKPIHMLSARQVFDALLPHLQNSYENPT